MLLGPTASGKSAASLALAAQRPIEIISVDSALVYRGMDIGTAKPTLAERAAAVEARVAALGEAVDAPLVLRVWAELQATPAWGGPPLWLAPDLAKGGKQGLFVFLIGDLLAGAQRFAGAQQPIDGPHLVVGVVGKMSDKGIPHGVQRVLVR